MMKTAYCALCAARLERPEPVLRGETGSIVEPVFCQLCLYNAEVASWAVYTWVMGISSLRPDIARAVDKILAGWAPLPIRRLW